MRQRKGQTASSGEKKNGSNRSKQDGPTSVTEEVCCRMITHSFHQCASLARTFPLANIYSLPLSLSHTHTHTHTLFQSSFSLTSLLVHLFFLLFYTYVHVWGALALSEAAKDHKLNFKYNPLKSLTYATIQNLVSKTHTTSHTHNYYMIHTSRLLYDVLTESLLFLYSIFRLPTVRWLLYAMLCRHRN